MPLVKAADPVADVALRRSFEGLLDQLGGADGDKRRAAARALSQYPDPADTLAARLQVEPDSHVRDALFGALVEIGGPQAAARVAPFIRSLDPGLRGGAIDSLKRLGPASSGALDTLLDDLDPDVRLLAIEVTRGWASDLAGPRLRRIFECEEHVNVCGAAVDVATEVGDPGLIEPLIGLRARFTHEPFLVFAVDVALSRIQVADEPCG
jgi:HEAT repeat protein